MPSAKDFFSDAQKHEIIHAIKAAESHTTGEIKVHIEERCKGDVMQRAIKVFHGLRMHEKQLKNCILIYMAVTDKKFAVIADAGIHKKVPEHFWEDVTNAMRVYFAEKKFAEGIIHGIQLCGAELKAHFPAAHSVDHDFNKEMTFGND